MKKEWFKKTDLWMIFAFTVGTIVRHVYQRFTLPGEQLPHILFHVAGNIVTIIMFVFLIAMYRKFMQKKSERVTTQTSAISTARDFFMVSELPAWAQKAIAVYHKEEGSVFNGAYGQDRLSIMGGCSIIFNGKKVYEDMTAIEPETTIDFKDLPKTVQNYITDEGQKGSHSVRIGEEQLLISDGQVYFDKKRVININ